MRFRTLYVDPPWKEVGGGKIKRGADRHYNLMPTKDIMAMKDRVNELVLPNSHLYLWVTNNFLVDGLKVMDAWGYKYITTITWLKDRIGLGQYYRGMTEHCLFGRKGNALPYRTKDGKRQQGKTIIQEPKTIHSRKPLKMYEYIEKVSHPGYIELFARQERPNWTSLGIEVDGSNFYEYDLNYGGENYMEF